MEHNPITEGNPSQSLSWGWRRTCAPGTRSLAGRSRILLAILGVTTTISSGAEESKALMEDEGCEEETDNIKEVRERLGGSEKCHPFT